MEHKKIKLRSLSDFVTKEAAADLYSWNVINKFYDSVSAALSDLSSIPLDSWNCEYSELVTEAGKILSDLINLKNACQVALIVNRQSIYEKYLKDEVEK